MIIRSIREHDLRQFVELCAEHAAFERAAYLREGKQERLQSLLFCREPSLKVWVAQSEGTLVAYASATVDTSTWAAERFIHMDCLFVRATHRKQRIGARLLREVALEGKRLGIRHMQWQTPTWNVDADRFYRRMPLTVTEKLRYELPLEKIPNESPET